MSVVATRLAVAEARRFDALRALTRHAGRRVLERFGRADVTYKDDASMVTDVDRAVQQWLTRRILTEFPMDAVLGEEAGDAAPSPADAPYVWIVDPIDGTNNFGRGMPGFSVSVGVARDGMIVGGAVYDPLARQLFTAWSGQGAWLNGRRLHAVPVIPDRRSLFSIRSPYPDGVPEAVTGWLGRYRLRRCGSTALHLCYVAMSALAFVYDHRAALWDIAGAAAVIFEAGAHLTAPDGAPLFPVGGDVWAGAPLAILAGIPGAYDTALRDLGVAASVA
jgi:myo-inositol-1(or 4)-monophosphatase